MLDALKVVRLALDHAGAPYIWIAKGDYFVDVHGLRHPWPPTEEFPKHAFDCSGLVNYCIWQAGGEDRRATHNAQKLSETCGPLQSGHAPLGSLLFYGHTDEAGLKHVSHVAISLDNGLKVEAAGGDESTLTFMDAQHAGAKVAVRFENRIDGLGWAPMSALLGQKSA